ncbi:uncharacterized protein [Clytia hemisphaerica]|uniref:Uncharacterized protein n=1 Tax=Clytia hemisphaerica TaxID=252671 RepID=A0A7M5TUI4_9CNID
MGHYNCTKDHQKVCLAGWTDNSTNCITSEESSFLSVLVQPTSILQLFQTSSIDYQSASSPTHGSSLITSTISSSPIDPNSIGKMTYSNQIMTSLLLPSHVQSTQQIATTYSSNERISPTSAYPNQIMTSSLGTSPHYPTQTTKTMTTNPTEQPYGCQTTKSMQPAVRGINSTTTNDDFFGLGKNTMVIITLSSLAITLIALIVVVILLRKSAKLEKKINLLTGVPSSRKNGRTSTFHMENVIENQATEGKM